MLYSNTMKHFKEEKIRIPKQEWTVFVFGVAI